MALEFLDGQPVRLFISETFPGKQVQPPMEREIFSKQMETRPWIGNPSVYPGGIPRLSSFFENGRSGKVQPARSVEEQNRIRQIRQELRLQARQTEL